MGIDSTVCIGFAEAAIVADSGTPLMGWIISPRQFSPVFTFNLL